MSDDEEDGSYIARPHRQRPETLEDALEIVSAIDGMVRVIIYLFML